METLRIGEKDIRDGEYIARVVNFNGDVTIEPDLGIVTFVSLKATGSILAGKGTGIKADGDVIAGGSIWAGRDVKAGESIKADGDVIAGGSIWADASIIVGGTIIAGWNVKADKSIEAGGNISAELYIAAGMIPSRKPTLEEMEIRCRNVVNGKIIFGTLIELGSNA